MAPTSAPRGRMRRWSAPTVMRMTCGTTSPTKPMEPLTATSVPVRSDVSANRKRLKRRTSTPSAAALSSPSISALRDRP